MRKKDVEGLRCGFEGDYKTFEVFSPFVLLSRDFALPLHT